MGDKHIYFLKKNKKGQFYLIVAIIFIVIMMAFVVTSNKSKKDTSDSLADIGKELEIESEAMMDYIANQEMSWQVRNEKLIEFTTDFSTYSNAENLYFIFGTKENLVVAGYRKLTPERIYFNSEENYLDLNIGGYYSNTYTDTGENINLIIKDTTYEFELSSAENFYFIISDETNNQEYVISNK